MMCVAGEIITFDNSLDGGNCSSDSMDRFQGTRSAISTAVDGHGTWRIHRPKRSSGESKLGHSTVRGSNIFIGLPQTDLLQGHDSHIEHQSPCHGAPHHGTLARPYSARHNGCLEHPDVLNSIPMSDNSKTDCKQLTLSNQNQHWMAPSNRNHLDDSSQDSPSGFNNGSESRNGKIEESLLSHTICHTFPRRPKLDGNVNGSNIVTSQIETPTATMDSPQTRSRNRSRIIPIKKPRLADDTCASSSASDVHGNARMYDSATWRMYHRITSARRARDMAGSSKKYNYSPYPSAKSGIRGLPLYENNDVARPKNQNFSEYESDASQYGDVFDIDI
mmetsp:Transcript_17024/g.19107  ORF Transcript_17024/g.19107 Transcript_17024/m.19107 type:complete len:333 (+) Transcript_17024:2-1000(+)